MKIVVISPSIRSLYSTALAFQLARDGHQVCGILVRRVLQWQRIKSEWAAGPSRLIAKVVRRGLQMPSPAALKSDETIYAYCKNAGIHVGLARLASELGSDLRGCRNFSDPETMSWLESKKPDVVFFTGGGMVPDAVLRLAGAGVVNCHIGPLPAFRGMDVVEWPLLTGQPCGLTCHFMDAHLDTGPILLQREIPVLPGDSIEVVRLRIEPMMVDAMREVARTLAQGTCVPTVQRREDGRQYFAMHPRLVQLAELAITRGGTTR